MKPPGRKFGSQTDGKVDGFTCAIGTGGTLAGTGIYLKEQNSNIRIAAADPMGANMYHWFKSGELKSEGTSITEGIGQGRVTANIEGAPIDDAYQIDDAEALPIVFDLLKDEGLCLGGSSGINIAGAHAHGGGFGPGPYDCDHFVRLWHALSVEIIQPCIFEGKGSALS